MTRPHAAFVAFALSVALAALSAIYPATADTFTAIGVNSARAVAPPGPVSWLAAGDSYSSGEGIPGSGMTPADDCAQSTRAYGPRAADILRRTREWQVAPLAFTACTGAVISDFYNHPNKSHPPQTAWARDVGTSDGRFDVVTMSFGGNDVDFGGVLKRCYVPNDWGNAFNGEFADGCGLDAEALTRRIENLTNGTSTTRPDTPYVPGHDKVTLTDFYAQVAADHLKPDGVLVVVGYPRLFAPSNQWASWRNDVCGFVSAADADLLGDAAQQLDDVQIEAVKTARQQVGDGVQIRYVSRLDEFDNDGASHSLCSADISWMNGLAFITRNGEVRLEHAYHPNEVGHQVTARDVAGHVAEVLEAEPEPVEGSPTPSEVEPTAAPIDDGTQTFGIGEEFFADCVVAWPTAPTYTATSIEMTMSCPAVPQQFLFVHVSYPDPDLPINPSTGMVPVHGEVVNIGENAYGFRTLYVAADDIDLGG